VSWWAERIKAMCKFCTDNDIEFNEVSLPLGLADLALKYGSFPSHQMWWCTRELKIKPLVDFRLKNGFDYENSTVFIGVRADESEKRKNTTSTGEKDGFDAVYPLAYLKAKERDKLIKKTGFDILPHRSKECDPCIFEGTKKHIMSLEPEKVELINRLEIKISKAKNKKRKAKGNPKYKEGEIFGFFDNSNIGGKGGILEQRKWAFTARGKYTEEQDDLFCDENLGYCGD
jgi:hypothetical protein